MLSVVVHLAQADGGKYSKADVQTDDEIIVKKNIVKNMLSKQIVKYMDKYIEKQILKQMVKSMEKIIGKNVVYQILNLMVKNIFSISSLCFR